MRQTSYNYSIPLGVPGGIFDLSGKEIVTRLLDDGVEASPGSGLVKGKQPGMTVAKPISTASAADFEGVFVNGSKNLENDQNGYVAAKGSDALGIMRQGKIWVSIVDTATISYGTKVAIITDGDNAGCFTDEVDASEATKVTINAKFNGKVDKDNGIAVIELK